MSFLGLRFAVLVGAAGLVLAGASPSHAAETLKTSSCLAKNNDLVLSYLELFHEPLNAKGKGTVQVNYIGGPEVTPSRRQPAAMQRGLVDIIFCPTSYAMGIVPEARLMPLANRPIEELRANGAMKIMQQAWAQRLNSMIIGWCCTDQVFHLYTSVKPKIDKDGSIDFEGAPQRSTELYNPVYKALNATPITIPAEDLFTAMQRGMVKGFGWPDGGVVKLGVKDYTKYMIDVGFFRGTSMIQMNLPKFQALPKKAQDLIVAQGIEYEKASMAFMRKKTIEDWDELKKAGMQVVTLSPAGEKKFVKSAYDAAWKEMEKHKYVVDFAELKSLLLKLD